MPDYAATRHAFDSAMSARRAMLRLLRYQYALLLPALDITPLICLLPDADIFRHDTHMPPLSLFAYYFTLS